MAKIIAVILSLFTALSFVFRAIPYAFTPTVEFDLSHTDSAPEISSRACGFLYGLAQEDVPSREAVRTLEISSVSQKVAGGLQHPIGDVDDVSGNLGSCDYIVVYLQDCFDTWYYCYDEIMSLRDSGGYDCEKFVDERFLPLVREKVVEISRRDYADRIVYCPYNECDNAVWFGTRNAQGGLEFDDAAKERFYSAWKKTVGIIRELHPGCRVGGPGYCDYDIGEIKDFLRYCKDNACLPDIMIYHELYPDSSVWWRDHVEEYRREEKSLGVGEIPIIVTEYGTMEECGVPSKMLRYITAAEKSGVYGNIAYWRLADNLCDTCAKGNLPNSCWWLYKWYCDMSGSLIDSETVDLLHSDFENMVKYARKRFHKSPLDGIGAFDPEEKRIDIICGGCDYDFQAALRGISKIFSPGKLRVTVEAVTYSGLEGEVLSPVTVSDRAVTPFGTLKIKIPAPDKDAVYHIIITPYGGETLREAEKLPERFEFESGKLIGSAYTYDSAYGTTGDLKGMCGGFESEADGVSLDFAVPESGIYDLSLIYGKANDGSAPADRIPARVFLEIDGERNEISLPNTVKSEYTDKFTLTAPLSVGSHNITLMHSGGTFVVDSLLVSPHKEVSAVYSEFEKKYGEHLVIAPENGYYKIGNAEKYLKKGFNYVAAAQDIPPVTACEFTDGFTLDLSALRLEGTAEIAPIGGRECLTGISSTGGSAEFIFNAPSQGEYALTLTYSNNGEGGHHAYNVDLLERYVTVTAGEEKCEVWCVNTKSDFTAFTAVAYIRLEAGENRIVLSNDGFNSFAGTPAVCPDISAVTLNPALR